MKLSRIFVALFLVAATVTSVMAQTTPPPVKHKPRTNTQVNPQGLATLQTDLTNAIHAMESALPIYDGNRVRSIHAAGRALAIVDKAINKNAATRPATTANDKIASGKAKGKYNAAAIAQSQANMQQGLGFLQTAQKDLQAAAGSTPNKRSTQVANLIAKAVTEATTAINLHSGQTTAPPKP